MILARYEKHIRRVTVVIIAPIVKAIIRLSDIITSSHVRIQRANV
jgi:hypothetical protein